MFFRILHSFSKNLVGHTLETYFWKSFICIFLLCIQLSTWFLIKFSNSMNFLKKISFLSCKLAIGFPTLFTKWNIYQNCFTSVIFNHRRFDFDILCRFFLISLWFNADAVAYLKHLWYFLLIGFIVSFFVLYPIRRIYIWSNTFILWHIIQ